MAKYLTTTDLQLSPDISRTKNKKDNAKTTRIMKFYWMLRCIMVTTNIQGKIQIFPVTLGIFTFPQVLAPWQNFGCRFLYHLSHTKLYYELKDPDHDSKV